MSIELDDLLSPPTAAEVREGIYTYLDNAGCDTTMWLVGAVLRAVVAAAAMFLAGGFYLISLVAKMGTLALARGDWLTIKARDDYGITRRVATFAETPCRLTNSGAGIYTITEDGEVEWASSATGAVFGNVGPFSLDGPGYVDVTFCAVEAGSGGSTAANTITEPVSALTGVTCTNATAAVGLDDETDDELLARCQESTEAVSPNGPGDVYRLLAVNAVDVDGVSCGVTRVTVIPADPVGTTHVLVGGASGAISGDVDDPETPLGAVYATLLANAVPTGVTLDLTNGTPATVAVDFWAYFSDTVTVDRAALTAGAETQLGIFAAAHPIGGVSITALANHQLFVETMKPPIYEAIRLLFGSVPTGTSVVVNDPPADIELGPGGYMVLGDVTQTEPGA